VMTLRIEKKINTELFTDRRAVLYIQKRVLVKVRAGMKRVKLLAPRTTIGGNEK